LPAVSVGLGLEERVVRRHVAKLEEAGWLRRDSWVRGEGSLLWLTRKGLDKAGLQELPAVRATRATWDVAHYGTRSGWAASQLECWGYRWRSRRELALEHDRWAIPRRHGAPRPPSRPRCVARRHRAAVRGHDHPWLASSGAGDADPQRVAAGDHRWQVQRCSLRHARRAVGIGTQQAGPPGRPHCRHLHCPSAADRIRDLANPATFATPAARWRPRARRCRGSAGRRGPAGRARIAAGYC
jgi:hypothetical protein